MRRLLASFLMTTVCALPSLVRAQASIEGTVALAPARVEPGGDARYPGAPAIPATMDRPLAVVFLEGPFPAPTNPAPTTVQMVQKDARFIPDVLPVRTGTKIEFPNDDDFYHNVF